MSLTSQIDDLKQQLAREIPRETLQAIAQALGKLAESGIMDGSCREGITAPSFELPNVSGKMVSSEDLLAESHVVLSFYRGAW
jgi:hypothetical protein